MTEQINTEGLTQVGEIETRALREIRVAENHHNSLVSGQVKAYQDAAEFVRFLYKSAGPYDDTRPLVTIQTWLGDRIREVQSPATMGDPNA